MRLLLLLLFPIGLFAQVDYQFAVVKYNGGGDWYANPSSLNNLIAFCNSELKAQVDPKSGTVEIGSDDIFQYPFIHLTGHGNIVIDDAERKNLANYLMAGGFLHVDDNYGMDKFIRPLLNQLLPNTELEELGADNPIFSSFFSFPQGLPKIHEHDAKNPQAFALYFGGRMVLIYTFESDLGDGWEDADVHNDSEETRLKALRMGANIVNYALTGQ